MSRGASRNLERGASNRNAGVLEIPGPHVLRRENHSNPGSRGGRRSAQEVFNRVYASWAGKEYRPKTGVLSNARCRQIRRKIRRALYSEDDGSRFEKGVMNYREASKKHGVRLHALRRRLDASFHLLEMAEDSWAADLFIQEVFQIDRKYQPAADGWVHPRERGRAFVANSGVQVPSTVEESHSQESGSQNGPAISDVEEQDNRSKPNAQDHDDEGQDASFSGGHDDEGQEESSSESHDDEGQRESASRKNNFPRGKHVSTDVQIRNARMKELERELERLRSSKTANRHSTVPKAAAYQRTLGAKRPRPQGKAISRHVRRRYSPEI